MTRKEAAANLLQAIDQYIVSRREEENNYECTDLFWEELLKEGIKNEFKPYVYFNWDGDLVECYVSNEPDYYKPYGEKMAVAFAFDTNEIVGVHVYGVLKVIKDQLKEEIGE